MANQVISPVSSDNAIELEQTYRSKQYAELVSVSSSSFYETVRLHGSPREYIRRMDEDGFVVWYTIVF